MELFNWMLWQQLRSASPLTHCKRAADTARIGFIPGHIRHHSACGRMWTVQLRGVCSRMRVCYGARGTAEGAVGTLCTSSASIASPQPQQVKTHLDLTKNEQRNVGQGNDLSSILVSGRH